MTDSIPPKKVQKKNIFIILLLILLFIYPNNNMIRSEMIPTNTQNIVQPKPIRHTIIYDPDVKKRTRVTFCDLQWILITKIMFYLRLGEIEMGSPKMRNVFWCIIIKLSTFVYCSLYTIHSSNFAIAITFALNFSALFLLTVFGGWLLFYIALSSDIALPTITTAIVNTFSLILLLWVHQYYL